MAHVAIQEADEQGDVVTWLDHVTDEVQQVVDRRFNRARYDADQTIAAFAAGLKDTVDLDSVRDDLSTVVNQALEPTHVSVWMPAGLKH